MKWIGQQIYDLASRFRNDVYLEDISTGTIASGAHLGLDSNNKIVKAVDGGGDITSVVAGTNLSGGATSGAATVNLADASTSVKGAASFSSDNFAASSGAITIKDGGVDLTAEVTGILPSANMDGDTAHLTTDQTFTGNKTFDETIIGSINGSSATVATIAGLAPNTATTQATQAAITTCANLTTVGTLDTGNATAIVDAASLTAAGKVELATTGEADTGTDTARAVTPAGLKSHVDAHARKSVLRLGAFYINDNPLVQNSLYFGGSLGHQPMNWGVPAAVGGVIGDTASFTIANTYENWGLLLPFDISKIEVHCSLRPNLGQNDDITVAVYTGIRSNNSALALTLTLAGHNSVAHSAAVNRYTRNDVTVNADLNKGTMIYVGVGTEDSTNMKNGMGYMSITVTER